MSLPITLTVWNRLATIEAKIFNPKWSAVIKKISRKIPEFWSIYNCKCLILQEPFTITESQLIQLFYIYDQDYYPSADDYVQEIIILVKILGIFLPYYDEEEKILFYNEGSHQDFPSTHPQLKDLLKSGKSKEATIQQLKGKLLPLRNIGLKKEMMTELHYLPPNNLLKSGGIKFQEGLEHFQSAQGK